MSDSLKGKCDDASQVHCPERQESAPMVEEENEELVRIIEEEQEYFITVGKFHIEEQQRLLIKVEEVPLYIKEEGVDVPVCTFESLGNEDEGPSEASSEPLSCSTSTESFQAENLMPPPPVSRDTSSHLQSQQRHRHHQNPCVEMSAEKKRPKFHEELFDLKGFRLEGFPQQKMKDEKIPIKKEEDHFTRSPGSTPPLATPRTSSLFKNSPNDQWKPSRNVLPPAGHFPNTTEGATPQYCWKFGAGQKCRQQHV
ncbi:uncharacterized protein LOC144213434 isoform X7 [Stigmatopora nigra]